MNAAVADPPHPDGAVAPRLGGEPLDGVVAVESLGLGVLVERDPARRAGPADVDAAEGEAAPREVGRRAPRRRCGASCPCRTGSSRGSPGSAPRLRNRPPAAAATGSPTARRRRAPGSGRPTRSRPRSAARSRLGRGSRRARSSPGVYEAVAAVGRSRPAHATMRRWTTRPPRTTRPPTPNGPWTRHARRTAYENAWITVWHDDVTRPDGAPGIYGVVHFANLAAGVLVIDDDDRVLLVGQHRYSLDAYSWEIPEGGVPDGESAARWCPARAARGDRSRCHGLARAGPAPLVEQRQRRAGHPVRRDRPEPRRRDPRRHGAAGRSAGCLSARSWR